MRELGMLLILNRRKDPGIFLKDTHADRCGWFGKPSQFPDAEHTEEELKATKKSEINPECPALANPNYVPY